MKSRTFYSDFIKTSFVKQLWVMGLMAFAYFMVLPVPLAVMVNNWADMSYRHRSVEEQFMRFMLQADSAYVLAVLSAVVIAFIQFSYLHSRRQMDFYGSLSVRKESLFTQRFLFGYIDFVIPYTVMLIICMIVGAARSLMTGSLFVYLLESWVYTQIGFILIYLTAALAILLTGRRWVAVLGCGVLLSGGYLLQGLLEGASATFFDTYYYTEKTQWLSFLSPVYLLYHLRDVIFDLEYFGELISGEFVYTGIILLIVSGLLLMLNRHVLRIRPAEKAGQSMSFEIPARVLHMLITVFGGIAIGMITMAFVYVNDIVWFFLGAIFGGIFIYVLIQFIYTLDIRRTFTYKWQILVVELVIVMIGSIYSFDLIGYDTYLPKQEKLESVAIRYYDDNAYNNFYINGKYYVGMDYALEEMVLPADDIAYEMLEAVVENQESYSYDEDTNLNRLCVRYRLSGGREVDREYNIPITEFKNEFMHYYDQENYRSIMVPSIRLEDAQYTSLEVYYGGTKYPLYDKGSEELEAFMAAYNRDMKALDSGIFVEEIPVAVLYGSVYMGEDIGGLELRVYEDCKETLTLLKEMGYDPFAAMNPENIGKIEIDDYTYEAEDLGVIIDEKDGTVVQEASAERMQMYTFTDKGDVAAILSRIIDEHYYSVWHERESNYYVRVYMEGEQEICFYGEFLKDQVPEELLEETGAAMVY